ncbi:MAG: 1-acyl-sn-glycerol-3-phosphate acyltransferase [Deltaproteobacteria bacterium]|nr:1-acyl-sn-glycerol-3-phosphate acyltransferase [Deltaproteobacteria bacterium]
MVDIEYLNKINLVSNPMIQRFLATFFLTPNYRFFADVDIQMENVDKIPKDETVIFAMNHTDRFNYWPFQYKLWKMKSFPYTTVWVKGKYYRNYTLGKILDACNLIPVPSMGYLIEEFYKKKFDKKIDRNEYRIIRDVIDGSREMSEAIQKITKETASFLKDNFDEFIKNYHETIMDKVADLSMKALFEKNLNLIIFPEGTRSLQLGKGRTGLAQLALHTEKKIVPIGCSNSDKVYTGSLPFAKSGTITYRVGDPLSVETQLREYRINEKFKLFSKESQQKYKEHFDSVTNLIMEKINALVDEAYQR